MSSKKPTASKSEEKKKPELEELRKKLHARIGNQQRARRMNSQHVQQVIASNPHQTEEEIRQKLEQLEDMKNMKQVKVSDPKQTIGVNDYVKRMVSVCSSPEELENFKTEVMGQLKSDQEKLITTKYIDAQIQRIKDDAIEKEEKHKNAEIYVPIKDRKHATESTEPIPEPLDLAIDSEDKDDETSHRAPRPFYGSTIQVPTIQSLTSTNTSFDLSKNVESMTFNVPKSLLVDPSKPVVMRSDQLLPSSVMDDQVVRNGTDRLRRLKQLDITAFLKEYDKLSKRNGFFSKLVKIDFENEPRDMIGIGIPIPAKDIPASVAEAYQLAADSHPIYATATANGVEQAFWFNNKDGAFFRHRDYTREVSLFSTQYMQALVALLHHLTRIKTRLNIQVLLDMLYPMGVIKDPASTSKIVKLRIHCLSCKLGYQEKLETPCPVFATIHVEPPQL